MNKTFKMNCLIKPFCIMFMIMVIWSLMSVGGNISEAIKHPQSSELFIIPLVIVLTIFLIYLIKTLFDISKDEFKSVTIDFENEVLGLTHKKLGVKYLHFNDVQIIKCISGEILRGIHLYHIDIIDKQGIVHNLTISNGSSFYTSLACYLPINMDERLFFRTK